MGSPEGINGMLLLLQENSITENGKNVKKREWRVKQFQWD